MEQPPVGLYWGPLLPGLVKGFEVRNARGSAITLLDWTDEMSAYIKGVDVNHLIADGGEGFDDDSAMYQHLSNDYAVRGDAGSSYHRMVLLPHIDMVSYHVFPSKWGLNDTTDVETWIRVHEQLALEAGKVAYIGEYGLVGPDDRRAETFDRWLQYAMVEYRSSGNLLWQMAYDTRPDYDGFTVYYPGDSLTISVLKKHAAAATSPATRIHPDDFLEGLARDTWNYLSSDWATDNHLPWSWRSDRLEGGDYANPAEIGFYMLSYIGAYELQRGWGPSWDEVEAEVGAWLLVNPEKIEQSALDLAEILK